MRHGIGSAWDALVVLRRRLQNDLIQDLRHGVRLAMRSPGLAIAACASIAVGIGGSTAAFQLVDAALLQQWPYPNADRLVVIRTDLSQYFSAPAFRRLVDGDFGLDHLTAAEAHDFVGDFAGHALLVKGHRVTREALALLGLNGPLRPVLGRPFVESDFDQASEPVLLISHRLWQVQFGASAEVVGRNLTLDGGSARIIGVLPRDFEFFPGGDVLAPLIFSGPRTYDEFARTLEIFGSLKPGVQPSQAAWLLTSTTRRMQPTQIAAVERVRERLYRGFGPTIRVLSLVSLVILTVCCVNFATLLSVRAAERRQELAVRRALGAERGRIIRQLVTEAMVLSLVGGMAGGLIAQAGRGILTQSGMAGTVDAMATLDGRVFVFALLLTVGTGLLFSVGPARRALATLEVGAALKGGIAAPEATLRPRWVAANWLPGSIQLALTMMLLVGAGLLVKSVARIQSFNPGYESANAVSVRFDLPPVRYRTDADTARFVAAMTERVAALPGVETVGGTSSLPYVAGALQMRTVLFEQPVEVSGTPEPMPLGWVRPPPPPPPGQTETIPLEFYPTLSCEVDPAFFRAMRIPLLRGREFTAQDTATTTPVVIINRAMADRYWSNVDPIGRRLRLGPLYPWKTVVGVVDNIRRFARDDAVRSEYYEPFSQAGDQRRVMEKLTGRELRWFQTATPSPVMFVVRSPLNARAISTAVTTIVREVDPSLPVVQVSTLRDALDDAVAERRFLLEHVVAFAGLALLLAAAGAYAVTAQVVKGRAHELSIRAAIGARGSHLIWLAIRDALVVAGIGGCFGILLSAMFTPQLGVFLYQVSPWDLQTFCAVALILIPVVVSAAYIPARRAAGADPLDALKTT
jgi:putative ABC transport system permease protein